MFCIQVQVIMQELILGVPLDNSGHFLALGDFLCIQTPNTGQLKPLFHTPLPNLDQ